MITNTATAISDTRLIGILTDLFPMTEGLKTADAIRAKVADYLDCPITQADYDMILAMVFTHHHYHNN